MCHLSARPPPRRRWHRRGRAQRVSPAPVRAGDRSPSDTGRLHTGSRASICARPRHPPRETLDLAGPCAAIPVNTSRGDPPSAGRAVGSRTFASGRAQLGPDEAAPTIQSPTISPDRIAIISQSPGTMNLTAQTPHRSAFQKLGIQTPQNHIPQINTPITRWNNLPSADLCGDEMQVTTTNRCGMVQVRSIDRKADEHCRGWPRANAPRTVLRAGAAPGHRRASRRALGHPHGSTRQLPRLWPPARLPRLRAVTRDACQ